MVTDGCISEAAQTALAYMEMLNDKKNMQTLQDSIMFKAVKKPVFAYTIMNVNPEKRYVETYVDLNGEV